MRGKKQLRKMKQLICLLLAVILVCGAVSLESVLAVESETMLETEALPGETQTEEMQTGETLQEPETEPVKTDPGKEELETAGSAETEPESNTDMGKYTNSISGVLWVDANEDGTYDSGEQALADYPVYLYLEGDTDNAVQTATTDADGRYIFEDIQLGWYVVGVKAEENGTEYLLPLVGVQNDNKFYFAPDYTQVISNPIDIDTDTVVGDIDAAMRTMPKIQTMANTTYYLDISTLTGTAVGNGVTISGTVATFSSVDPTDTYIITGTTTTNSILVSSSTVNITLSGVNITHSTPTSYACPFRLSAGADVTLTLADGTTNSLRSAEYYTAVLNVPAGASLTIQGETAGTGSLSAIVNSVRSNAAGIGGSNTQTSGTITINSGTVIAQGYWGPGIGGGGYGGNGGTTIINGGTVTATGSSLSAGIGGGWGGSYASSSAGTNGGNAGTVIIRGGTVNATGSSAGIGGGSGFQNNAYCGSGGIITIEGGTVNATSNHYGPGIGGGGSTSTYNNYPGSGGTITITGGTVTATGATGATSTYGGTGIGGGTAYPTTSTTPTRGSCGTINISGGCVTAKGGWGSVGGIGGSSGTIIFTGGSIYPTNYYGTVSVSPSPTNGSTNGNDTVGMLTFASLAGQDFSIVAAGSATTYTYKGIGHVVAAYPWLAYPGVTTDAATNVTNNSATMNGTYYMNGTSISSAYFEWGTSTSYGNTKTLTTPTNTTSGVIESVSNNLTGLTSNTTYHYRLVITVGLITVPGNDMTFTTKPIVDTLTAAPTGSTIATISGTIVLGNASISDVIITYATDAGFTANVVALDGSSGVMFTNTTYTADITGLTSGQTYHVKVEAVGPGGISDAKTGSFVAGAYPITEKFVDLSGNPVDPIGLPNNTLYVAGSYTASGIPASHTVGSDTYEYVGYKLDSYAVGDTLTSGTPLSVAITGSRDVYYVYSNFVDLTISKTITGAYANMTKAFNFTVYFQDSTGAPLSSGTTFTYTGGVIAGSGATAPSGGTLTLDSGGKATFTLSHGQTITIAGVSTSGKVQIVETTDANYTATFIDSVAPSTIVTGGDTGIRNMTSADRTFAFTNARIAVTPAGISTGGNALLLLAILAIMAGLAAMVVYRRRRKEG